MLKQKPVSAPRRRVGGVVLVVFAGVAAGAAYAATTPAVITADRYSLELSVSFNGKPAQQLKKMCLKPGEYANVNGVATEVPPWQGRVVVFPAEKGEIEIRTDMSGGTLDKAVRPIVRTMPGQRATIEIGSDVDGADGRFTGIKLDMTAGIGC